MDANINHRISQLREELTNLEAQAAQERENTLRSLPSAAGVGSIDELIALLIPYSSKYREKRATKAGRPKAAAAPKAASEKKGTRTRLTAEQKQQVVDDINGGMKGVAAAKKYGVSVMTIQNIKKAAGIVKSRS